LISATATAAAAAAAADDDGERFIEMKDIRHHFTIFPHKTQRKIQER